MYSIVSARLEFNIAHKKILRSMALGSSVVSPIPASILAEPPSDSSTILRIAAMAAGAGPRPAEVSTRIICGDLQNVR